MSFDTWQKLKLSDFLEINPKRLVSKDSLISFIDMAALPINGRDILKCNIAEKKFNGGGAKFRNGDTLLARITPCLENGKTAFVNCLSNDDVAFGSTEFIVLAPKNKSDSLFVYYLVRSDNFRSYIIPRMEGTSGRQRVPNNAVGEYECFFPPLNERVEIASILSSLDNRISLLRETNTTLEASPKPYLSHGLWILTP
jgi:type I restriction enzyme S subunit